jgi:hypothetical protein
MRGADIGSGQHEGLWCLNEAASLSGVGLRRVESVLGLQPSGLQFHDDVELMLEARAYDPEQHWFPNLALSSVMGGLPGSSHPLVFGRDENGAFVYQPDVSGSRVSSDSQPTLTDVDVFLWAHVRKSGAGATMQIVGQWGAAGSKATRLIESALGAVQFQYTTDGSTVVTAVLGAEPSWWTAGATAGWVGAFYDVSEGDLVWYDGGTDTTPTWASVETDAVGVVSISDESAGTAVTVASDNTPGGARFIGRVYSAGIGASTSSLDDFGRFDAAMFIPGNRGHGATATDAQGNTWTVSRAGSPLSVIDDGDGNGKRVRGTNAAGAGSQGLTSNQKPSLSATDVFLWVHLSEGTSSARVIGQYGDGSAKCIRLLFISGAPYVQASVDGTSAAFTEVLSVGNRPSWLTGGTDGWLGVLWDNSAGDLIWYDGGTGGTPSWTAIETDSPGTMTLFNGSGTQAVQIFDSDNSDAVVFEAGIGASTSSMYDYSHFDAAQINRHQWRCDNTVDSDVDGETWAVTYTDSAEDANDPPVLWHYGDDYAYVTGSTSNYLQQTIDAGIANGSVISLRVDIAPTDATPAADKRFIDNDFYPRLLTTGKIRYGFNGVSTFPTADSSVALPIVDGQDVQVRIDHDHTAATVDFYYRFGHTALTDDTGWIALGTQQSITAEDLDTNITGGLSNLRLGDSTVSPWEGKLYRGVILDDGAAVWNVDISDASGDGTSFTDSVTGNTVTINRATSGFATAIVKAPVALTGDSHYVQVPHHDSLDADPVSVFLSCAMHDEDNTWKPLLTKKNSINATEVGYMIQRHSSNDRYYLNVGDGTSQANLGNASSGFTNSTRTTISAAIEPTDMEFYLDGVSKDAETPALSSIANTENLVVGADGALFNTTGPGEIFALAVLSKRVSDAEALAIHNELAAS